MPADSGLPDNPQRISVVCDCGKKLVANPMQSGKRLKCPSCGQAVVVPPFPHSDHDGRHSVRAGIVPTPTRAALEPHTSEPQTGTGNRRLMRVLLMIVLWLLPVVAVIGGGAVIHFDAKWRQQARLDAANAEVREAVKGAAGWLKQSRAKDKDGENVEQRLMKAIAANEVSEKANADAVLETVRTRRAELAADSLFDSAKTKLDAKAIAEAVELLHRYAADRHATKKPEASRLLADYELATSDKAAVQTLMALSDERFTQFKNTGKLDDRKITHPILAEIRATTLRRNLETANQCREEIKVAEANRQQSQRLALAAPRAAEDANAAKEKAANDAAELIRSRLVGDWCWGKYSDGSIKFAQDGTFVETGTLACRGLWTVDRDGTIRLSDDKIVVRIDINEDKISIAHTTSGYHPEAGAPNVLMGTVCRRFRESAMNPDAKDRSVEQQIQALDQQIEALWRAAKGMKPQERRSVERQIQALRQTNNKLKAQAEKAVYAKLDKYEKCIGPDGKVYMRKKPAWVLWREAHPAEAVEEIAKAAAQMRENEKRLGRIQFTTPEPTEAQKAIQRQNAEAAANRVHPAN